MPALDRTEIMIALAAQQAAQCSSTRKLEAMRLGKQAGGGGSRFEVNCSLCVADFECDSILS